MKKILSWIFTIVILGMGVTLAAGIVFAGPSQAGANEQLAKAPVLWSENGLDPDFLGDTADWFADHFYLRQELISVNNALTARIFGTSGTEEVIQGRDGWLYYHSTLADFTGSAPLTQAEIGAMTSNLALMEEYVRGEGRQFLFLIAPNKNSVYPGHMPNFGARAEQTPGRALLEALRERGVSAVDFFDCLGSAEETLYFAHDSHWNSRGAALAADAVNACFGRESRYFEGDFSETAPHDGDLYAMMYPAFTDPERGPVYGGTLDFSYTTNATQPDSIVLQTESGASGSLLAYRDSFGNLLYPYLADSYGTAKFSRSTTYDLTQPGECVMIELVERNLRYLLHYVPAMPAPARELALDFPEHSGSAAVDVKKSGLDGMQLVQGTLPMAGDAGKAVYVLAGGTAYQAFILEDNGFAAHIPQDAAPEGVVFYQNGEMALLTVQ